MYKRLVTLCLLLFCSMGLFAQKTDSLRCGTDYSVAFEPVFGFNNCFKFDLEAKPMAHNFGFELTPEIYTGQHILNHTADDISGFGIGIYQKYYVPGDDKHPVMISYGATYRRINVSYHDEGFIPYQQNGLDFYQYKNFTDVLKNQSLQLGFTANVRLVYAEQFFSLDVYSGGAYKFAKQQSTYPGYRNYNAQMYDYGYKGFTFLLGFKLGFHFQTK